MATAPAITPASTDSLLAQAIASPLQDGHHGDPDKYRPTRQLPSGHIVLAPEYKNLPQVTGDYVLWLTRMGELGIAERVGNCRRHGTVVDECGKGHFGTANQHFCGEIFCATACGGGRPRLLNWMARRECDHILSETQVGIELSLPMGKLGHTHTQHAAAWSNANDQIREHIPAFLKSLEVTSALRLSAGPFDGRASIRLIICRDSVNTHKIEKSWRALAGPGASCRFQFADGARTKDQVTSLLLWGFSGWEYMALYSCGEAKAKFRTAMKGTQQIKSYGTHYRALHPSQVKERNRLKREARTCPHPDCRGYNIKLIPIPLMSRHTETIDQIQSRYQIVDWSSHREMVVIRKVSEGSTCKDLSARASP